jgi:hypothetical protein
MTHDSQDYRPKSIEKGGWYLWVVDHFFKSQNLIFGVAKNSTLNATNFYISFYNILTKRSVVRMSATFKKSLENTYEFLFLNNFI